MSPRLGNIRPITLPRERISLYGSDMGKVEITDLPAEVFALLKKRATMADMTV
ncbi:hypothetical protein [Natronoglycomyces albus]|uniref:Uncharacterized protein n=1 Tax=Natronoglycomyces albus TaxID=2811108 RepID=A0A895XSL9_9ACTN|nr:hypothetical protein [Natronoglycomyces albus]QSB06235.1 hypothetical protein JQS30_04815 [Natronoglycomyces albus]